MYRQFEGTIWFQKNYYYIGFQKDEFDMSKYKKSVPLRYTYFCPNPLSHDIFIQ